MQRLTRERCGAYEFLAGEPALAVKPGERFVVETEDALGGLVRREDQLPTEATFGDRLARDEFNPCAGPIHVEGARPGDVLAVEVHEILVAEQGASCIFEGVGLLADSARYPDCRGPATAIVRHLPGPSGTTADGAAVLGGGATWPLRPHVGTIAVAPARPYSAGADANYGQGAWGGNIDVRDVAPGNRVLLPVQVDGACLYLGDVHGSMGDGELYGTGDETAADVTLSCELLPGPIPWARIETPDALIQLCSYRPLDAAIDQAFRFLLDWLVDEHGLAPREAYLQLGLNPGVRINVYQAVALGRLACTVGVAFPRSSLPGR